MKKYLILLAIIVLASCSKENDFRPSDGHYALIVNASKDPMSKALGLSGSTLNASWTKGDKVKVYVGDAEIGELTAQSTGASTKLSGELTVAPSADDVLTLKFLSPAYSTQDGTLTGNATSIDKVCDYATATITVKSIDGSEITVKEKSASFTNQQAIVKFTFKYKSDGFSFSIPAETALTVNDGTNDYTVTPSSPTDVFYVAIPATSTVNLSTTIGGITYSYNKTEAGLLAGKYYEIGVKMWRVVNLAGITENVILMKGDTATGTLGGNYQVTVANEATVIIKDVTINGVNNSDYYWAGITCQGNATIILSGTSTIRGFHEDHPGISVPATKTLTIKGEGSLTANSNGYGAGIGGIEYLPCGNIEIQSGTITATGGDQGAAGIGSGLGGSCGTITISGGTVTATGGACSAGIGSGANLASCGAISITDGVTSVISTRGIGAPNSIGNGYDSTAGTVTIGGTEYWNGSEYQNGGSTYLTQETIVFPSKCFSVSNTRRVYFSPGNLQYQASTGTWRFAEHQYDYVGAGNASIASDYTGWIDLFGWGTSGWNNTTADAKWTNYQPWSSSNTVDSGDKTNTTGYGPSGANSLTGANANGDWGVYNSIMNGAVTDAAGTWRTLTIDEWIWILGPDSDANPGVNCRHASTVGGNREARYATIKINDVRGILLFPDAYLQPSTVAAPSTVNQSVTWSSSPNYTTDQWSAMETAGAIFIPAAGYRDGTTVTGANVNGAYWSSTVFNKGYAKSPTFYDGKVNFSNSPIRHFGRSVRLVRDRD